MNAFSVRVAAPSDAKKIAPILAELLGKKMLANNVLESLNTNLLRLLQTPGATLLLAENDAGETLGFVSVWTRWGLLDDKLSGLIDRVVVRPSVRQSSVSSALLEQAMGACQALGCGSVELVLTPESTVDVSALQGFGFEEMGRRYFLEIH